MELRFKHEDNNISVEQKMDSWPLCLYKERDPDVRFAMLGEAEKRGLTPELTPVIRTILEKVISREINRPIRICVSG